MALLRNKMRPLWGLLLVGFPKKSAILLSVCVSFPSLLIYEQMGQFQSNIKNGDKNLKDRKFSGVS